METHGTVTFAPSWYRPMMSRVKRTLLRRSGTLKMFFRLESIAAPRSLRGGPGTEASGW